jgi:hypothetical protein
MATPFQHEYPSEHSAEDVWKAVNTPVTGELAEAIYPWFNLSYVLLDEIRIGEGTTINFAPNGALRERLGPLGDKFPELPFKVEELDDDERSRTAMLDVDEAEGKLTHHVEETADGSGLLVVRGALTVKGMMGSFAEGPAIKYAIARPAEQLAARVPEIIRQAEA